MNCSMPGLPVHHQLPEFTQTDVHWVGDAIQPSHPLSSPFPPAFNLSQHQRLFQWVPCLHQVANIGASASVLPMSIQGWFPLGLSALISLLFKELSRVFSSIAVWKHQFFCAPPSSWSTSHVHTWLLEKPQLWLDRPLLAKWLSLLFNTLSRFVIAFLPRSRHLLICFNLACLTMSSLPWFTDLTFQVPMQYYSSQHQTLLLSPVTSTAGCFFALQLCNLCTFVIMYKIMEFIFFQMCTEYMYACFYIYTPSSWHFINVLLFESILHKRFVCLKIVEL